MCLLTPPPATCNLARKCFCHYCDDTPLDVERQPTGWGGVWGVGAPLFDFYCGPLPSGSRGGERTDLWFTLGRPPRMSSAGSIGTRPGCLVLCRVWPGPGAKRAPRARGQAHRHSQTLGSKAAVYLGGLMLFLQIF